MTTARSAALLLAIAAASPPVAATTAPDDGSRQATGVKVGEVTADSAVVWVRLTANASRNPDGPARRGKPVEPTPADDEVPGLLHAAPGAPGRVRLRYGTDASLADAIATDWFEVGPETDSAHSFAIDGLEPATTYHYAAETAGPGGSPVHEPLVGRFRTAPDPDAIAPATFAVVSCQMYKDVDHPDGFAIYEAMAALDPAYLVLTGDTVYYDNEDPRARSVALARYHWQRMDSFPRHVAFFIRTPGYWMKDDHDLLSNDCWPSQHPAFMRPLTFEDGLRLFRERNPLGDGPTYRTFRWGEDLQIWLVEGRDFRSPNNAPDGPDKTIWGAQQKAWLKRSMAGSDAAWKVLISPTPIVGPDRDNKRDNHANAGFAHEGAEVRRWLADELGESVIVVCGDRHWQYHSVDPTTGLHEFSSGAASDEHAGGTPGFEPDYHRFHRVAGGFLTVEVSRRNGRPTLTVRHHDVDGAAVSEYVRAGDLP